MTRTHTILTTAFLLLTWCAVIAHGESKLQPADPPTVDMELRTGDVYLGGRAQIDVIVRNTMTASIAALPEVDGLNMAVVGRTVDAGTRLVINGRQFGGAPRVIFELAVEPSRVGEFTIPPISISAGSTTLTTEPYEFSVRQPGVWDAAEAILEIEEPNLVPGQRTAFKVELSWPAADSISSVNILAGDPPDGIAVDMPRADLRRFERRATNVEIFGQSTFGRVTERRLGGRRYTVLDISGELEATAPTSGEIGPITFTIQRSRGVGRPSEVVVSATNAVPVTVADFPEAGKPDDFDGLVGVYAMALEASSTSVRTGDPIELTLDVTGPEPFRTFTPPALAESGVLGDGFRIAPDWELVGPNTFGRRKYTTTIRPLRDDLTEIPSLRVPYFDPETRSYGTAATRAIPLSVEAVRQVTADDAVRATGPAPAAVTAAEALTSTDPGIWALPTSAEALARPRPPLSATLGSAGFVSVMAVPPALAFAALLFRSARDSHDPARARRRAARRRAERRAQSGSVADAARGYIADLLDRDEHTVTTADTDLLGLARDNAIRAALASAEANRFGQSPPPPPTADEFIQAVRAHQRAKTATTGKEAAA